jgi:hypothetical protein
MASGEIISEWKGRLNSLIVRPFDCSDSVKYEMSWLGEVSGRLTGQDIGTDYLSMASDGTGTSDYYGVLTTPQGEVVMVEGHGTIVPAEQGRVRSRFAIKFRTAASRLAWLTNTIAAFESETEFSGDLTSKVFSGRYIEWK